MDFHLTEAQKLIQSMTQKFCKNDIEPIADQLDREGRIPDDLLKKFSLLGLFGMTVPKEYDGAESGDFAHILAIEQLAYAGSPAWWPVAFNNSLPQTICRFGSPDQKKKFVKGRLDGSQLFSIQFTEPDTGSDPKALRTTARKQGDYYIIEGHKRFSTFGARPGPALVWAKDDADGCTCFIIEKLAAGYSAPKIWEIMGSGGVEPADVYYDHYRVHEDQVLGEKGKGLDVLLYWVSIEKLEGCMVAVSLAQAALDEAIKYTKERTVRGKPMAQMQGIRFELADMYAKIQSSKWLVYRTSHLLSEDFESFQTEAAACKLVVQPLMSEVIATAFRLHGAYGYAKDYKIERLYRAQPANLVISVSLEINKSIVADALVR